MAKFLFSGDELTAQKIISSLPSAASFSAPITVAAADKETIAVIYAAGKNLAALPDFTEFRTVLEQLKNKKISTALVFEDFPQRTENWLMYWAMILPFVDFLFIRYAAAVKMFEPEQFAATSGATDPEYAAAVSLSIINLGVAVVFFALPEGIYLRSSSVPSRLNNCGAAVKFLPEKNENWRAREIFTARDGELTEICQRFFTSDYSEPAELLTTTGTLSAGGGLPNYRALADSLFAGPFDKIEA